MWKKIFGLLLVLFFVLAVFPAIALEECTGDKEKDPECWKRRGNELQDLLNQNQGQQKTLASTITYLNNKLALTESQIKQTEEELKKLEEDIATLSVKISRLDVNLNETSTLLIHRVGEAYKRDAFNPSFYLLSTRGLTDFLTRMKYLKLAQQNDKKILLELQSSRDDKQQQKDLKEEKQAQVEDLKKELASQTATLASQRKSKEQLLEITKNDEKNYQVLLSQARAQRDAFSQFVASRGGATILENQTHCDNGWCYYNQRDSKWGTRSLGNSTLSVAEYGCLVSSVAMIANHKGFNINPLDIAVESSAFFSPDSSTALLNYSINIKGRNISRESRNLSELDNILASGQPVIAGLYSYSNPSHFIVIKGKNDKGYIMNDPFLPSGYDKPLTDQYNVGDIKRIDIVNL